MAKFVFTLSLFLASIILSAQEIGIEIKYSTECKVAIKPKVDTPISFECEPNNGTFVIYKSTIKHTHKGLTTTYYIDSVYDELYIMHNIFNVGYKAQIDQHYGFIVMGVVNDDKSMVIYTNDAVNK